MKRPSPLPWIFTGLAALSVGVLAAALLSPSAVEDYKTATVLNTPRSVAPARLVTENGDAVTVDSLRGQWHLVFAGFTSCPDVCPTTLNLLNRVVEPLGPDAPLRVLLLSVDPERDTPQKMKSYLAAFNPRFGGLTGEAAELETLRRGLGLLATQVPQGDGYTVDHSSSLVLLNPDAQVVAYLSPPFDAAAITGDLRTLMEKKT